MNRDYVDIIIPVYKGLEHTEKCISSLLSHPQKIPLRIVVIDDCSPDSLLKDFILTLNLEGKITLLKNKENLGFAASVNRAMTLHADGDVILLNSDTEVANDWVDRLRRCAYSQEDIGTVTPFSNNATICSYPVFCADNPMPDGWDAVSLDNVFQEVNRGCLVDIPTAVGFCMYIKRGCIVETGLFDVKRYGQGYGEENDFCMRARKLGWRHVLCADVFVYHKGSVSFSERAETLKREATEILLDQHPEYIELVRECVLKDAARPFRLAVDGEIKKRWKTTT